MEVHHILGRALKSPAGWAYTPMPARTRACCPTRAGKPKRLSASDVEELVQDVLRSSTLEGDDPLIRGLRRGVGIHHGGLPKTYRQMVEILFRAGHLRVSKRMKGEWGQGSKHFRRKSQ